MNEEENTVGMVNPSPKEAAMNLVRSVKTPLIFFGLGIVATLIYQSRKKASVG